MLIKYEIINRIWKLTGKETLSYDLGKVIFDPEEGIFVTNGKMLMQIQSNPKDIDGIPNFEIFTEQTEVIALSDETSAIYSEDPESVDSKRTELKFLKGLMEARKTKRRIDHKRWANITNIDGDIYLERYVGDTAELERIRLYGEIAEVVESGYSSGSLVYKFPKAGKCPYYATYEFAESSKEGREFKFEADILKKTVRYMGDYIKKSCEDLKDGYPEIAFIPPEKEGGVAKLVYESESCGRDKEKLVARIQTTMPRWR